MDRIHKSKSFYTQMTTDNIESSDLNSPFDPSMFDPNILDSIIKDLQLDYFDSADFEESYSCVISTVKPRFDTHIYFTDEAISIVKEFSDLIEIYGFFHDMLDQKPQLDIPEMTKKFQRQLAYHISESYHRYSLNTIITPDIVIDEIRKYIISAISNIFGMLPPEGSIKHMIEGYPLQLLSTICNTSLFTTHMIGETMRKYITMRLNYIPRQLQSITQGNAPLLRTEHNPGGLFESYELDAIYGYLGSRKMIYVHMMVNALYGFGQVIKILSSADCTYEDLRDICKSAWFYLLLYTTIVN